MPTARDVLGPGSPLSRALAGWEHREGQLAMAEAVEAALDGERHLFVEAGTGTGKTLAYLVPAVLSGRKVVVSTATRALQEQIFVKDLPLVAEALARLRRAGARGAHEGARQLRVLAALRGGARGRRPRERPRLLAHRGLGSPRPSRATAQSSPTCPRTRPRGGRSRRRARRASALAASTSTRCFVTRMRREAEDAQIVVVNHHLFLADLALRSGPRGAHASVIPAYDAVVFDEAHQLEDIATDFFGVRVSSARVEALASRRGARRSRKPTRSRRWRAARCAGHWNRRGTPPTRSSRRLPAVRPSVTRSASSRTRT